MNECKPDGFWNQDGLAPAFGIVTWILYCAFVIVGGTFFWIERLRVYDYAFIFRCFRIQPHVDADYRVD
ncbi:hypothetical protein MERCI_19 [Klebsiella phage vB_KaeM_Merci]|nr:hypothetical protein MERCI_19 [Klebsiella phage vB_KaeM_Merci]